MSGTVGAGGVAGQREHEGLGAPGGAVVTAKLGVDEAKRRVALAGNGERKRHATAQLGLVAMAHRQHIFLLRARRIAGHVESEATVGGEFGRGRTERGGLLEQPQRRLGLAELDEGRGHAGLHPRVARRNFVGARVEAQRRLGIAHPERLAAGAEQRVEIARIVGEGGEIGTQRGCGVRPERLDDRPRRHLRGAGRLNWILGEGAARHDVRGRQQQQPVANPPPHR